jgi:hypothetical protein
MNKHAYQSDVRTKGILYGLVEQGSLKQLYDEVARCQ